MQVRCVSSGLALVGFNADEGSGIGQTRQRHDEISREMRLEMKFAGESRGYMRMLYRESFKR